jgi:DNA-binding HxlR family transcriptional regulator
MEAGLLYPKSNCYKRSWQRLDTKMADAQHFRSSSEPTSALFDLLGRRWALRILWEIRDAALTFQTLQSRCDSMSTSVLSRRLGELKDARLVEKDDAGRYGLTGQGAALLAGLDWIDEWTQQWSVALGERRAPRSMPRND